MHFTVYIIQQYIIYLNFITILIFIVLPFKCMTNTMVTSNYKHTNLNKTIILYSRHKYNDNNAIFANNQKSLHKSYKNKKIVDFNKVNNLIDAKLSISKNQNLITNKFLNSLRLSTDNQTQSYKIKRALSASSWKEQHPQTRQQMSFHNDGEIYTKEQINGMSN